MWNQQATINHKNLGKQRGFASLYILPTSQNPPCWNPPWLSNVFTTRKDPESEWLARDNPGTNPITIKPETVSHMVEPCSWVPSSCCSLLRHPFPIKSLALSTHVPPRTIHFRVLDKSPLSGPGKGAPSWFSWGWGKRGLRSGYWRDARLHPCLGLAHAAPHPHSQGQVVWPSLSPRQARGH